MASADPVAAGGRGPPVYYTRCPIAGATAIAAETGLLAQAYAGTGYALTDIATLGEAYAEVHYTHALDRCLREGGGSPPVWARARGADTRVIGIALVEEPLAIFVRGDDRAQGVADLAGRRIGLPRRAGLVFDFWRFAAEKGFHSALRCHGMRDADVIPVDVEEADGGAGDDLRPRGGGDGTRRANRYAAQLRALLEGRIDAMFGKGLELAPLERDATGRIRVLFDVARSPDPADRVNNSTPRLVTVGTGLLATERDAAVRYLLALLRAARWAPRNPAAVRAIVAADCGVDEAAVDRYLPADYAARLAPAIDASLVAAVGVLKSFLVHHGYVDRDFDIAGWVDPGPLAEALARDRAAA